MALDAATEAANVIDEIATRNDDALGLRPAAAQSDAIPDLAGLEPRDYAFDDGHRAGVLGASRARLVARKI